MRLSILTLALVLGVGASARSASEDWSGAAFERARERDQAVLAVLGAPMAPVDDWAAARGLVLVRVDEALRPDLADELGLAARELGVAAGAPAVLALTADARPFAAAAVSDAQAFARFADDASAAYRAARSGVDPRANTTLEAIRAAQRSSPALRPLDAGTLEAAARAAVAAPELASSDGPLPYGPVVLLLAEHRRARRPELLKLATAALDLRLARRPAPPDPPTAAGLAVLLATWTHAHETAGRAAYGREAERIAARLRGSARADGCFAASGSDGRAVAQWNGLAVAALAATARVAGRREDRAAAETAAECVLRTLGAGAPAALVRAEGAPSGSAFLDDYAALVWGFVELFDATGDVRWRARAQAFADAAVARFLDMDGGGFFLTDAAHEPLPARLRHAFDAGVPAADATLALGLLRLARATGEPRYADLARGTVHAFLGDLQRAPRGLFTLAVAASEVVGPAPASPPADASGPSVVTRRRVTLHARGPQAPVAAGGSADLEVELEVAPGAFVIAHGVRAKDLAGLGLSVPSEGVRSATPRYPTPSTARPSWNAQPLDVHEGRTVLPVRVTLARDVTAGPRALRIRVLFQECDASSCRTPDGAVLEVPVTIAAR